MIRHLRLLAALLALVALSLSVAGAGWAARCDPGAADHLDGAGGSEHHPSPPTEPSEGAAPCPMAPAAAGCSIQGALPAVSGAADPALAIASVSPRSHDQPTPLLLGAGLFRPPQR